MGSSRVKLYCLFICLALLAIISVVLIRAVTFRNYQVDVGECKSTDVDFIKMTPRTIEIFQQAVRLQTIYKQFDEQDSFNTSAFLAFHKLLLDNYPLIHNTPYITREIVNDYSLLYTVDGSNASLTPYMLAGHIDVVPVEPQEWNVDPFGGEMNDGFIYGRGTLDDKIGIIGLMEALEYRLSKNIRPNRTFYLAFGHDEEVTGCNGAQMIGNLLASRGVKIDFVLDEGMLIIDGGAPGIQGPVAYIATAEKGHVTIELKVVYNNDDLYAMPSAESSIGILSKAVANLENTGHPNYFGYGPERLMLEHLAVLMTFPYRVLMTNLWLFSPLVGIIFDSSKTTRALVKTTTALTVFNAGYTKTSSSPSATALVNHRIHPCQSVKDVLDLDINIINDDRVKFRVLDSYEPSTISSTDTDGYKIIYKSIRQVFQHVPVVPSLMVGNTDTLHYQHLTKNIYRFSPVLLHISDIKRIHGNDERIRIQNLHQALNFYYHIYDNADKGGDIPDRATERAVEL